MLFQYYTPTYGGGQLQNVMYTLQSWGFTDALLPFLLIFVLIFAILQRIAIFTKEPAAAGATAKADRKINSIIAFAIAALVVVPHITQTYPPQMDPINIINNFLPAVSILLVAIFVVLILLGLVGKKVPTLAIWLVAIVALIILLLVIVKAAFPAFVPEWFVADPNLQATIIAILVVGLIIWFVMREPEEDVTATPGKKFAEMIKQWFE